MQTITRDTCCRVVRNGAAAIMLAGALGACATGPAPDSPSATIALNQTQSSGPNRWELVRWQQPDGTLRDIPHGDNGQPVIFEFSAGIDAAQGTVSGTSGCNRFTGSYGKTDTGIRFDRIAGTRMACPPPRMELESVLLTAMQTPFLTVGTQPSAGSTGRQIIWKTASADLLQFVEREGIGQRGARVDAAGSVEKTVYIDSQRVECSGVGRLTCYRWRESPDAPWQLWYGPIEGLDFEPGVSYKLRVREYKVPNPPADASSIRWQLLSVESRTRAN
jgi:heat shock protein HslJ